MRTVNWARVILGGILAGLVINGFEFAINGVVLAQEIDAAIKALGKQVGGAQMAVFVVWGFLMGLFAVWLYAAIRPRYGPGPKTAVLAGFAVWLVGYLLAAAPPAALELFPMRIMVIGLAVGLVEVIAGTLLGARLYREEG